MKMQITVFILISLILTTATHSFAGKPPGLEKQGKIPHGFSEGQKEGWDNGYPPGWDKKSNKQKIKHKDKDLTEIEIEPLEDDYGKSKSNKKNKKKKNKNTIKSGND